MIDSHLWTDRVPLSTDAMAHYKADRQLQALFEYRSRYGEPIVLWEQDGLNGIKVPRAVCPVGIDNRVHGWLKKPFQSKVQPRSNEQHRILKESHLLLEQGESFVLQAQPGFGKTVIALDLIAKQQRTALVIVPKSDLIDQWKERALQYTDLKEEHIGIVHQSTVIWKNRPLVIGSLQTLAIRDERFPEEFCSYFGMIIGDEIDCFPTETLACVMGMFPAFFRLGLSATPRRIDGKERTIFAHVGPIKVISESTDLSPTVGVYPIPWKSKRWPNGTPMAYEGAKTMHIQEMLAKEEDRNQKILELIGSCYQKNRRTVIFSSLVGHLEFLRAKILQWHPEIPESDTALYVNKTVGGSSARNLLERSRAQSCPLIFATWKMMGRGTDVEWLDCALLTMPLAHPKQPIGRILRYFPGKPQPAVLDLVDLDGGLFEGYAKSRQKYYRSIGAHPIIRY